MRVIVVGAGAAGLAATYALRKAGVEVTTLEAGPVAGGRARCYHKEGFIFDTGAQFMARVCLTQLRLCAELGLQDQVFPFELKTAHWRDNRMYPLPASGSGWRFLREASELLTFRGFPLKVYPQMARLGLQMFKRFLPVDITRMNPECLIDLGDTSVAEFTLRYGGPEALDWAMAPMVAALTLGEAEEVSIPHMIGLMGLYKGLLLLEKGIGSLPAALYAQCRDRIRLSTPVQRIVIDNTGVRGVETREGFMPADQVICATTATTARALMPDLPATIRRPLETVRYSATVHVTLALKRPLLPGGVYVLSLPRSAGSFLPSRAPLPRRARVCRTA